MNGVEILSTEKIVSETTFDWTVFWIITGVFVGMMGIITFFFCSI